MKKKKRKIKQKVKDLKIEDKVIFLGLRKDIPELLQAMDIFVFPSLYEGLGISVLEAQASGLYCICSTGVPNMAKISDNFERIDLKQSIDTWCGVVKNVFNEHINRLDVSLDDKYDVKNCSALLASLYSVELDMTN